MDKLLVFEKEKTLEKKVEAWVAIKKEIITKFSLAIIFSILLIGFTILLLKKVMAKEKKISVLTKTPVLTEVLVLWAKASNLTDALIWIKTLN